MTKETYKRLSDPTELRAAMCLADAQARCFRETVCSCRHYSDCQKIKSFDASIPLLSPTTNTAPPLVNPTHRKVYVVGRLADPNIVVIAEKLRKAIPDWEIFDDWHAAHPEADTAWRDYEVAKGLSYEEALRAYAAQNVFKFDKSHLDTSTHGVLVLPAGRSGHMEIAYLAGCGKSTAILLDQDYDRWDVMYSFVDLVSRDIEEIIDRWTL